MDEFFFFMYTLTRFLIFNYVYLFLSRFIIAGILIRRITRLHKMMPNYLTVNNIVSKLKVVK